MMFKIEDKMDENEITERTYAQIDLEAIRQNIRNEKEWINKNKEADNNKNVGLMAVIKADAYGHGDVMVAKALQGIADAYGVAIVEEGIRLRENGITEPILILGHVGNINFKYLIEYNIETAIFDYDTAKNLSDEALKLGKKALVHIKVDTGMGRIGFFPNDESVQTICRINELEGIKINGIFTHFARADEKDLTCANEAFNKFSNFFNKLEEKGIEIPTKHAANSASIIGFNHAYLDMVRSGITTYGLYPSDEVSKDIVEIKPAMSWYSTVSFVKKVESGTPIGYGGTFVTKRDSVIATIPVGYADGYRRNMSNKGKVIINGKYAPIVGRICMDQFMVDVTDLDNVKMGDKVTLMGRDGDCEISADYIANLCDTINYEIVCDVGKRVPRVYIG